MADGDTLRIRIAVPEDLDEIMDLAMMACEENAVLPPDPQKLLADIWPALNQDHGIIGVVGKPNDIIEGVVLLRIGSLWYSRQSCVEEKCVFVHEDYRSAKGGRAKKLCEFSKTVADTLGLPLLIGVLSSARTAQKQRLYQRIFGEPSGSFFLYGAKTGAWKETLR